MKLCGGNRRISKKYFVVCGLVFFVIFIIKTIIYTNRKKFILFV